MTKAQVIREVCAIIALAYGSIGDYTEPSDGFCDRCQALGFNFQHSGRTLDYVRRAVVNQLKQDGYAIADGFDKETGKEQKS